LSQAEHFTFFVLEFEPILCMFVDLKRKRKGMHDILIIGGGLAGLINAIHLSKAGLSVVVLEKNDFPKHKVCGEYISNEVLPYLQSLGVDPFALGATSIDKFILGTSGGTEVTTTLPLGGFGISRYTLDHFLLQKAVSNGCVVVKTNVEKIEYQGRSFKVSTREGEEYLATFVIGAYGKRSALDGHLNRKFIETEAPFLAVKNHYKGSFPDDLVALHNFEGGYCGISKVENDFINVCYLANYKTFKKYRNIETFQQEVLFKNPQLKDIFEGIQPTFAKPLTISQVSFSSKKTIEQHVFMSGDAAGMIHPLCGNGMGMAIHSAKILAGLLVQSFNAKSINRLSLEEQYAKRWKSTFQKRLNAGRFLNVFVSNHKILSAGIYGLQFFPKLFPFIIKQTHGEELTAYQD